MNELPLRETTPSNEPSGMSDRVNTWAYEGDFWAGADANERVRQVSRIAHELVRFCAGIGCAECILDEPSLLTSAHDRNARLEAMLAMVVGLEINSTEGCPAPFQAVPRR